MTTKFESDALPGTRDAVFQNTVLWCLVILAVVIVLFALYIKLLKRKSDPNGVGDVLTKQAKIVNSIKENLGGIGYITKYIFEFSDGTRISLVVKPQDAQMLAVGDEGMLEFQGEKFISFTR